MYTIDYFIRKFSAIPDEEWTIHQQQNDQGQRCALGHCMPVSVKSAGSDYYFALGGNSCDLEETKQLGFLFKKENYRDGQWIVAGINNGCNDQYQQSTPKARILAALYDLKEEEEKKKQIIKYVAVNKEIREKAQLKIQECTTS